MDTVWNISSPLAAASLEAGTAWAAKHPRLAKDVKRVRAEAAKVVQKLATVMGGRQRETLKFAKAAFISGAQGGTYPKGMNPRRNPRRLSTKYAHDLKLMDGDTGVVGMALQSRASDAYMAAIKSGDPERIAEAKAMYHDARVMQRHGFGPTPRRNPLFSSTESGPNLYESFHGKPSRRTTTVRTTSQSREDVAQLGILVELKVHLLTGKRATIEFPDRGVDRVRLCASPDGRQIYFVGGDQTINLRRLGMDTDEWARDLMVLGILFELTYRTRKGFDKFALIDYYHALGEETGMQPLLLFDTLNQELSVAGGQYNIKPEGIVN